MNVKLNEVPVQHVAASVQFKGEQITVPVGMAIPTAISTLQQFMQAQEQVVKFSEVFKVFPWDGAHALKQVLEARFGFVQFKGQEVSQEVGPNLRKSLPWGKFELTGLATLVCDANKVDGRWVFEIGAITQRKSEGVVRTIFKDLQDYLADGGSIYQGKAIKLRLQDDNGDNLGMPEPKFIDTAAIDVSALMFNKDIEDALRVNLFTPIQRVRDLKASGIPIKRATLLAGLYGTGKTMAASAAAKIAVDNGVTYLYIQRASELAEAIEFAKMYSNPACVIFCEDVDREASGERDEQMDHLLNVIDGLDTKSSNVMIVLTTNDAKAIHPAMLRPGRLDAVINILPPNHATAEKILRKYCGHTLGDGEDISKAANLLAGQIPAVLAEVVKRAKLAQLSLQPEGSRVYELTGQALFLAAQTIMGQVALLEERINSGTTKVPTLDKLMEDTVVKAMTNGGGKAVARLVSDLMN